MILSQIETITDKLKQKRTDFIYSCKFDTLGKISAQNYASSVVTIFRKGMESLELPKKDWCLAAIGGFGREELSFASDFDLLFLYKRKLKKEIANLIKALVQSLWDSGFEVGHRVIKLKEIKHIIKGDFPFLTSTLEATFLGGDNLFYKIWRTSFFNTFFSSYRKKISFLNSIIEFREERFKKYGNSSYITEPHIKEGKGGLRDIHIIKWLDKIFFNSSDLDYLVHKGYLLKIEKQWLEEAENFLWQIRLQLHRINKRAFDRLTLQYQKELAKLFLPFKAEKIATENFMEIYYRHSARIRRLSDFLLEKIKEEFQSKKIKFKQIGKHFTVCGDDIKFSNPTIISATPQILMDIFWWMAKLGVHFHHETGQVIKKNLDFFSTKYICDKKVVNKFFDILLNQKFGFYTLYTMMETGFLDKFLPEFSHIRYKVQYDTYHTYTVDEHLLRTVYELHQLISDKKYKILFEKIKNFKKILFLAGLLHDIGKGSGKDHCIYGSKLCKKIGKRLYLDEKEIELLCFLVEKHLLLIHIALKRDLSEERPIEVCALEVGEVERLYLLYLLTIADSRATGPNAWNVWRSALLDELLIKVERFVVAQDWDIQEIQNKIKHIKLSVQEYVPKDLKKDLLQWLDKLSIRYLLNTPVEDIILHFKLEKNLKEEKLFLVAKRLNEEIGKITIICHDRENLFDIITGVFWAYGLNILSANIHTRPYKVVVDEIIVKNIPDPSNWERLWEKIRKDMLLILENKSSLEDILSQKQIRKIVSLQRSVLRTKNEVLIDNEASDFYTVIEVYTWDRTGILCKISRTLHRYNLNISMAKISTLGSQVADIFYVTDKNGEKIYNEELLRKIRSSILTTLKEENDKLL